MSRHNRALQMPSFFFFFNSTQHSFIHSFTTLGTAALKRRSMFKPTSMRSFSKVISNSYNLSLRKNGSNVVKKYNSVLNAVNNRNVYNYIMCRSHQTSSAMQQTVLKNGNREANYIGLVFIVFLGVLSAKILVDSPLHCASKIDIDSVKKDIIALIDKEDERRGDGTGIGPTLVRLAWHASGTYSKEDGTGGSYGSTMRYSPEKEWGANAGLQLARDFLEPIKKKYPGLSTADIWTLAGCTAIENMGGPQIRWRPGRKDNTRGTSVPDGRLPGADKGAPAKTSQHLRDIFYRMGFTDKDIVCLSGAHALGRCHTNASGYWGPWTRAETTFSNEYFRLLIEEKWTEKKTHEGKPWTGPQQYENKDKTLMMLPSDLALVQDSKFKTYVQLYAKDEKQFFDDFANLFAKLMELGVNF